MRAMTERHCSSPIDPPQQGYLERLDGDPAESRNDAERVGGNTALERSPTRQRRIKPWRWQVR